MFNLSVKTAFIVTVFLSLTCSAFAQILYTPPFGTTPTPTVTVPTTTPTATVPTTTPTTTPTPTVTTTTPATPTVTAPPPTATTVVTTPATTEAVTAVTLTPPTTLTTANSSIPGYSAKSYSVGRTIAYIAIPFAAVAATYYLGDQQIVVTPYAGFEWMRRLNSHGSTNHMRDAGLYGVRAAAWWTDQFQLEGSFGYMNHFESRAAPTVLDQSFGIRPATVHGLLYDVNINWNFLNCRILPYVTGGVGGLSTMVRNADLALANGNVYETTPVAGIVALNPTRTQVVGDNSAFFSVNYGAGVQTLRTWGPVGFRADYRGRTFPNFAGEELTWQEATAGITLTFGER